MLRIAHIGAGTFSRRAHAPALRRLANETRTSILLAGISDVDADRPDRAQLLSRDFGYQQSFVDWRVMLERVQPDVIVCTVAPAVAAGVLAEIIPLGVPIITEKPPALTVGDACRLATLADSVGTVTYVMFNRRRMPSVERARRWHTRCGPVTAVRAQMFRERSPEPGFCVTTAVHAFDTVRYLASEIETINTSRSRSHRGTGTDYFVSATCAGGAKADIDIRVGADSTREAYSIESPTDVVEVVLCPPYSMPTEWTGWRCIRGDRIGAGDRCVGDFIDDGGVVQQYRRFLECVRTGAAPDCSLRDASVSLRVAAAAAAGYSGRISEFHEMAAMS